MLHSLLEQEDRGTVRIDYLHDGGTPDSGRRRLARMVSRMGGEIEFHLVPDRWVEGLPIADFTRKATWYRIALDELLPDADRVLWLDVDLLVMDSLQSLWEVPFDGNLIGAVTNVPPGPDREYTERPELGGDRYFNAGVLLFDLAAMRRESVGPELREYAVRHADRLKWRDQDALNEVLHARRLPLHPRWNCMNSVMLFSYAEDYFSPGQVEEARRNPAIRHFEGPLFNKPWHLLADATNRRQYVRQRRRTPWPLVLPEGCSRRNLARYIRGRIIGVLRSTRRLLRRG